MQKGLYIQGCHYTCSLDLHIRNKLVIFEYLMEDLY